MAKGQYGLTPWGAWFIGVLDSYQMGARLNRGRTYANTGRVLSLDLEECRAVAQVEGNYRPFYRVEIVFPRLNEREKVYRMIEEDALLLSRIAAGELPEEFLAGLQTEGIDLIPKRWQDMKRSCNCPDDGDPCKHMAALYYIIAKEIDADPHVLFRLRGMDLAARFGAQAVRNLPAPFIIKAANPVSAVEKSKAPPPLPSSTSLSTLHPSHSSSPSPLTLPELPHCAELIISLLPPDPPFSAGNRGAKPRDFTLVLAEFYHSVSRQIPWTPADSAAGEDTEHYFSRSRWTIVCPNPAPGAEAVLESEDILGKKTHHTVYGAFLKFVEFSSEDGTESYAFLFYLFKFLNLLCSSCAFIPFVLLENGTLRIIWRPFDTLPLISGTLDALAARSFPLPLVLASAGDRDKGARKKRTKAEAGAATGAAPPAPPVVFADGRSVVDLLSSALLNEWVKRNYFAYTNESFRQGSAEFRELLGLFFQGEAVSATSPALRSLPLAIDRWLSVLHLDFTAWKYRFTVKSAAVKGAQKAPRRKNSEGPAAGADSGWDLSPPDFSLSMDVLLEDGGKVRKTPLSKIAASSKNAIAILRAPTALSNYLPEIRDLASRREVRLSEPRLVSFLDSASSLLTRLGIEVELPKTLHRELKPRLVLKGATKDKAAGSLVSYLQLDSLLHWEWQIAIGDKILDLKEFEALVKEKRKLVRFKDGFVRLDPEELAHLIKKAQSSEPGVNEFLKAHFAGDSFLSFDAEEITAKLFEERRFPVPEGLTAKLRPYQKRGYDWILSLLLAGFGCILADDMGLGKTVQAIAVLLRLKKEGLLGGKCLIVAPASLLDNWEREIGRFAPDIRVSRYHGARRRLEAKPEVFLTTYQTAVRDAVKLGEEAFAFLIVDEAHLMKNAETRISRTIKQLRSRFRLALSGTPVENRLEDLRSLFDFVLPGYLGTPAEFKTAYRVPIEVMRQRETAETLRKITAPFLLRRLKTDKTIIKDLPEKIITNEYAVLEKEQAALYESVVAESIEKSERMAAEERPALVLALLTGLKQICDHPRVFDKESPAVSSLSGKAGLLLTLLQEILAGREKTLIFSQYVETLLCLKQIIERELGEAALVYHGGLGQNMRSEIIQDFQNTPASRILLVSLRAGGLGLNLTAASRVIHYDLWYNPAVENQATDRAFRIGQKRTVFVHRFITKNSFEEKIDAMITSKRELADMTVASGESWLARMSHEELKALFDR